MTRLLFPVTAALLGVAIGIGVFTFVYAEGHSYLTNDPEACANCHIMQPQYSAWLKSSHRAAAVYNDCHMPYIRQGAMKVSDHWVRSPLLNVNNACQTCHNLPEEELISRVHIIQDRTYEMRNVAIDAVLQLTRSIQAAVQADSTNPRVAVARQLQRRAQFYTDFVEAENSMGFHADQEAVRILGRAVDFARQGQVAIQGGELPSPAATPAPAPAQTVTPAAVR